MQLNRKTFLQQLAILGAGAMLPADLLANTAKIEDALLLGTHKQKAMDLLLLHTNDFHSRIEPFPANHPMAGKGGIANLATLIQQKRATESHVLLLDCGDVFQGTPYFNFFGGDLEYKWMQKMGYHATTIGNHDFDNGIQHLANMLEKNPGISMVNCNYNLQNTPLKNWVNPYKIVQMGLKKLGVVGLGIKPENLIMERMIPGLTYNDPVTEVQKVVNHLNNTENCDAVFVISHLGYHYDTDKIDDLKLAAKTHGITAILGGHTHTFLEKATEVINAKGQTVLVNQAGWGGLMLGQLKFSL